MRTRIEQEVLLVEIVRLSPMYRRVVYHPHVFLLRKVRRRDRQSGAAVCMCTTPPPEFRRWLTHRSCVVGGLVSGAVEVLLEPILRALGPTILRPLPARRVRRVHLGRSSGKAPRPSKGGRRWKTFR